MLSRYIRENKLSDGSKTYDLCIYDLEQENGEDRLCIPCEDSTHADDLKQMLDLVFKNFGVVA